MAGGRRTKREEILEFIQANGLDPGLLDADGVPDDGVPPPALDELRTRLLSQLSSQIPDLNGIALVQAYKAIEALARTAPDDERDAPPLIADVVSGAVNLPAERKREILAGELARMEQEMEAIREALK